MSRLPDHLIRCYLDGELSPEDVREVERMMAEDTDVSARVEQERILAGHVKRAMQSSVEAAPAEVRRRIEASLTGASRGALRPTPVSRGPFQMSQWLRGPQRVNVFAVAACLMLVAGAVLVGIFGRPIDRFRGQGPIDAVDTLSLASDYVSHEHERCTHDMRSLLHKVSWTDRDEASGELRTLLGALIPIPDLSDLSYEFIGAGQCRVPGDPNSCHLIYQRRGSGPYLSIFIEPNHGQFVVRCPTGKTFESLQPGDSHCCPGGKGCRPVRFTTDGQLCYFLTACRSDDLPALEDAVKNQMGLSPAGSQAEH